MKLLYKPETQLFQPYPRSDDEEVIGLDPVYHVYTVNQDSEPSYDPGTQHLEATESVDHEAKTVTRGWNVVENPPLLLLPPTMRSFRLACGRGLWESIEAVVTNISDADAKWDAQQFLEYSTHVSRNHPLVLSLIAALTPPLTSEQVDNVFTTAIANDGN